MGLATATVLFGGFWVFGFWLYLTHEDPDFISDEDFIKLADQRCADAHREFEKVQPAAERATNEERALIIDSTTAIFVAMVTDLKAMAPQVAPADAEAVRRWLESWDKFVGVGPEYAAAIRRGNRAEIERVGNQGDEPNRYINEFAEANDIGNCAF
jgi:hypothetical protein